MNYEELVKALRVEPFEVESEGLAKVINDAAAAIEALQAEVDTLKRTDSKRCQECLYLGQPVGEQQLPKRGEWIHSVSVQGTTSGGITYYHGYTCSVCGGLMGRKGDAYCYKCGAKMEVQDGK